MMYKIVRLLNTLKNSSNKSIFTKMHAFIAVIAYWALIFGGAILLVLDHQERPIEQRKFGETVMAITAYTLTSMLGYSFLFSTQLDKRAKKEVTVVA